jgi:F-type H+-transporting ATPase subunit b
MRRKRMPRLLTHVFAGALLAVILQFSGRSVFAQEQPAGNASQQASDTGSDTKKSTKQDHQGARKRQGFGSELAEETNEATGAEEENANLKHSAMVQLLARMTGLSVHQAHLLALGLNFGVIVVITVLAARKFLPGLFRSRTEAIQQALQEARAASQDANRRLADIENRLRQMDVEIGQMQASAEKEGAAEEERIQKAAEEDIRKVVRAAEQEIAAAAKQARRELSIHTADLAITLARKQINVDTNTDQVLVRTFASHLISPDSSNSDKNGGKDGH